MMAEKMTGAQQRLMPYADGSTVLYKKKGSKHVRENTEHSLSLFLNRS